MKTLNVVYLLGSVGKDPEIKSTGGGTLVANFSLATSYRYKDQAGNWTDSTDWHNIVCYGRTAEVVRDYVKKGDPLHLNGRISQRSWEKDGQKHYRTEIVVDGLIMLGGKGDRKSVSNSNPAPAASQIFQQEDSSDDVPF